MTHKLTPLTVLLLAAVLAIKTPAADLPVPHGDSKTATTDTREINRERAKEANEIAAREAVRAMLEGTRLDLDIRLVGPTSVRIAGDR